MLRRPSLAAAENDPQNLHPHSAPGSGPAVLRHLAAPEVSAHSLGTKNERWHKSKTMFVSRDTREWLKKMRRRQQRAVNRKRAHYDRLVAERRQLEKAIAREEQILYGRLAPDL